MITIEVLKNQTYLSNYSVHLNQVGNHNCCFRRSAGGVSKLETSFLPSIQQIKTSFFFQTLLRIHPRWLIDINFQRNPTVEWCKEDRINRMYSSIFLSATIFSWTQVLWADWMKSFSRKVNTHFGLQNLVIDIQMVIGYADASRCY